MEKINNKRATNINTKAKKAEKGTVTIRKRGNSFEARVRLELKNKLKGQIATQDYLGQHKQNN